MSDAAPSVETPAAPAAPAAEAAATPSAPAAAAAPAANDWTSSLSPELKGFVQNKNFKDPATVVESYQYLEKLMGAREKLVKLPDNMEDAKAMAEIYDKLGRPATPDGYQITVPKEGGDPEFAKWAKGVFHELGFTGRQATTLVDKWNEFAANAQKAETDKFNSQIQEQMDSLKRKWGAAYDQNLAMSKRAAMEFGVKPEIIDAMEKSVGFAETMEFFNKIGAKMGEASFIGGNTHQQGFGSVMTPDQAKGRINSLKEDAGFRKRLMEKDSAALDEWTRLHQMASP
jgi:hypothetical protein